MINFSITNKTKQQFDKTLSNKIKKSINIANKILSLKTKNNYFDITIVGDCKIKKINSLYRNKNKITDVISLAYNNPFDFVNINQNHLGEIYVDLNQARRQAKKYGHGIDREICFLIIHGLLHLIGYDHIKKEDEDIMFKLQEEILDDANIKR